MDNWKVIQQFLRSPECNVIHKWAHWEAGWCIITNKQGRRFKVSKDTTLVAVNKIVNEIKKSYGMPAQ